MPLRRACWVVLASACAVAGLAGCSSAQHGLCAPAHCRVEVIPGYAYALDVTTAGRVRWQVPLGPPLPDSGLQVSPLTVGAVAVFAQDDLLYGLRLADGHRLWSRTVGQDITGMWRWQNLVVVLTQPTRPGPPQPALTGLDASTGQPRWTLPVGDSVEALAPTADGGLTMVTWSNLRATGALEVVDLSSGRVRWKVPVGSTEVPPLAVGGGAVLFAENSPLTSYDDRTGHVRWTDALTAPPRAYDYVWPNSLQASAGLVYLTGAQPLADGGWAQVLVGISAADGRPRWRVVEYSPPPAPWTVSCHTSGIRVICTTPKRRSSRSRPTGPPSSAIRSLSLDPYAPGLMSVTSSSGVISQDELARATGRVRWQVVSTDEAIATRAGVVTAPGPDQVTMHDTLTGQTRWTARLKGGWLPLVTVDLPASPDFPAPPDSPASQVPPASQALPVSQGVPVFPAGPLLLVPEASSDGSDLLAALRMSDGRRTWQIRTPAPIAAPLSAVRGGILVYTAVPQEIFAP
jgi:outer membrane protein assembly factor BamB